jgi:hypothetical protein
MAFMVSPLKADLTVNGLALNIVSGGRGWIALAIVTLGNGMAYRIFSSALFGPIGTLQLSLQAVGAKLLPAAFGAALLADYHDARRVPWTVQGATGPGHPLPSRRARLSTGLTYGYSPQLGSTN